jgi:hypothetical protein
VSAAVAEPMIEAELWVSLVSLLRAYAAAAEAHGGMATRVEAAENTITLTASRVTLSVECDLRSGVGTRTLRRGAVELARASFRLLADGRLEQGSEELDLDHAAIDWVAELMRAGRDR